MQTVEDYRANEHDVDEVYCVDEGVVKLTLTGIANNIT